MNAVERAISLQDLVRTHADTNEAQRHLVPEVAAAFAREGLYRIAAPEHHFGGDEDPMTQVRAIEAIAQVDGSSAWNLMIGIEAFGLIAPGFEHCRHLIEDPSVVMCSSTAAVGRAEKVEGGYRVTGRWPFVSGCHNAQIFGATVRVWEHGEQVSSNMYAIVELPDWQILDTWHTGGLCGSGSHDVVVEDVFVPNTQLVSPIGSTVDPSPLLSFPLGARLAYNKMGVAWGLTHHAIESFTELAEGKQPRFSKRGLRDRPRAQRAVAEAQTKYMAGRCHVMTLLEEMWQIVQVHGHITTKQRALFQLACSDSARSCGEAVTILCEAAGTTANQKGHPLERIQRDIRVVGQHTSVAAQHIDDAGRILLGLQPQEAMLGGLAVTQ